MAALNWLRPAILVAGTLLVVAPGQAQDVTILRGNPPVQSAPAQSTPAIDCKNPYYAQSQYCEAYGPSQDQDSSTYDYGETYPYYD